MIVYVIQVIQQKLNLRTNFHGSVQENLSHKILDFCTFNMYKNATFRLVIFVFIETLGLTLGKFLRKHSVICTIKIISLWKRIELSNYYEVNSICNFSTQ